VNLVVHSIENRTDSEVNGIKVHEILALATDNDTTITRKFFCISEENTSESIKNIIDLHIYLFSFLHKISLHIYEM